MRLAGARISLEQMLLARIADESAFQSWTKTKDAQHNRNRPKSILKELMEGDREEAEVFTSPEAFHSTWERIVNNAG